MMPGLIARRAKKSLIRVHRHRPQDPVAGRQTFDQIAVRLPWVFWRETVATAV